MPSQKTAVVDVETTVIPSVAGLFAKYITQGPHPEYKAFEARVRATSGRSRAQNVWDLIEDAVTGKGGFSNGEYLFPFKAETENNLLSDKLQRRKAEADYDRFAEHVCNAPWDLISSGADMIERKADGEAQDLVSEFWESVDARGTSIGDFLEYPFRQARQFGTGWIFIDRPEVSITTKADDRAPENRPYAYGVPTRNVVYWSFDDDGNVTGIVVLEPGEDYKPGNLCPVRVWTVDGWAVYTPLEGKKNKDRKDLGSFMLTSSGPNNLGIVPAIPVWNDKPDPGNLLGQSEMVDVARLAQTVYNVDSECREIERKCALFLAIPVKNTKDYEGRVVIGTDSAMLFDGDAGKPEWISPDLTILDKLDTRRTQKIDSAYAMAHLRALNPSAATTVQTNSGFHAEVEFQKTERRVARHAGMLEWVEKQLVGLYLRFYGTDPNKQKELFTVTYPRDFGVRDMAKLIEEVEQILGMNLGPESDKAELTKLFQARHPRKSDADVQTMVESAIAERSNAAKQKNQIERIKMMAAKAGGQPELVQ